VLPGDSFGTAGIGIAVERFKFSTALVRGREFGGRDFIFPPNMTL
jgi:hypothetical protein